MASVRPPNPCLAALVVCAALLALGGASVSAAEPDRDADPAARPGARTVKPHDSSGDDLAPAAMRLRRSAAGLELTVPVQAPAAAFALGGHLWILLATERRLELRRGPSAGGRPALPDPEITRLDGATLVRLRRRPGWRVRAARDDAGWRFAIGAGAPAGRAPALAVERRHSGLASGDVAIRLPGAVRVREIVDPVSGSRLVVVAVSDPMLAAARARRSVRYRLLPTALGLVVEPLADGVAVEARAPGVVIRYRRVDRLRRPRGRAPRRSPN